MKSRIKAGSIGTLTLGIAGALLFTSNAFAGCYFVACPNQQAQPAQPQSPPPQYQSYESDNSNYESGYSNGYAAGKKAAGSQAKGKKTWFGGSKKKSHKVYSSKGVKKSAAKSVSYSKAAPKKKKTYYSNSATQYHYSNNYSYNANAVQDSAKIYGSNQYGPSINVANFMGRGETWVSSSYKIISYTTPSNVQMVNGRQCGWGMPIASNGNIMKNNTWVCRCETGWRPDNH